jgi:hypothetical protein
MQNSAKPKVLEYARTPPRQRRITLRSIRGSLAVFFVLFAAIGLLPILALRDTPLFGIAMVLAVVVAFIPAATFFWQLVHEQPAPSTPPVPRPVIESLAPRRHL